MYDLKVCLPYLQTTWEMSKGQHSEEAEFLVEIGDT